MYRFLFLFCNWNSYRRQLIFWCIFRHVYVCNFSFIFANFKHSKSVSRVSLKLTTTSSEQRAEMEMSSWQEKFFALQMTANWSNWQDWYVRIHRIMHINKICTIHTCIYVRMYSNSWLTLFTSAETCSFAKLFFSIINCFILLHKFYWYLAYQLK